MDMATGLFLVLLGCTDDLSACQRIEVAPTVYVSATTCSSDHARALMSKAAMSADYPTIIADCMTGKQLAALGKGAVDLSGGPTSIR